MPRCVRLTGTPAPGVFSRFFTPGGCGFVRASITLSEARNPELRGVHRARLMWQRLIGSRPEQHVIRPRKRERTPDFHADTQFPPRPSRDEQMYAEWAKAIKPVVP